jgi:hypothetical protein
MMEMHGHPERWDEPECVEGVEWKAWVRRGHPLFFPQKAINKWGSDIFHIKIYGIVRVVMVIYGLPKNKKAALKSGLWARVLLYR